MQVLICTDLHLEVIYDMPISKLQLRSARSWMFQSFIHYCKLERVDFSVLLENTLTVGTLLGLVTVISLKLSFAASSASSWTQIQYVGVFFHNQIMLIFSN